MKREYQEFTGKTVEEAVRDGLRELGLKEEEADIRVLEEGKKKLFGYVKARVEIAPKGGDEEAEASAEAEEAKEPGEKKTEVHCDANGRTDGERAVEFLEGLFDILKITACTELLREEEKIEINVTAANTNAVAQCWTPFRRSRGPWPIRAATNTKELWSIAKIIARTANSRCKILPTSWRKRRFVSKRSSNWSP